MTLTGESRQTQETAFLGQYPKIASGMRLTNVMKIDIWKQTHKHVGMAGIWTCSEKGLR